MSGVEEPRDAGMSMVELIIVAIISSLLLGLIATIFGVSMASQQRSAERDQLTMQLNAATASITESVKNSSTIRVSAGGLRLDAKVLSLDGTTWECRAWQLESGTLRYSAGSAARSTVIDTVRAWASLTSGEGSAAAGTLGSGSAFTQAGNRLSIGLALTQGESTVTVSDGSIAQVVQAGGPACW